jgi:phosphoribosylaminoimidazolecarboxamide formyltransferase/IMP cyclohydrolase
MKIKRALISVYDKTGIVAFARSLSGIGVEIISTGGTAELLKKEGIPVKEVSEVTRFPEMLNGRVKTLHPNVHAGLLALRDNPKHLETLAEHNIKPIDFLVVNLYPFWDAVRTKTDEREIIEMIDIGGPSMLRSAAKNYRFVAAISDPVDYTPVLEELKAKGALSEATHKKLAAKVFKLTSYYDSLISGYFSGVSTRANEVLYPQRLSMDFEKVVDLRYGENPHQKGSLYRELGSGLGVVNAKQLHGKELSFNNLLDLDAAFGMVEDFKEPACAIMKHTNPCGFAIGRNHQEAFKKAYACDPLSAFGSIIGFNGAVDGKTAAEILECGFIECVIAKGFSKEALSALSAKKNLRLLVADAGISASPWDFKKVTGGLLLQDRDIKDPTAADLKCVTKLSPKKSQIADLLFAFKVCRYPKSNAIVIVKNGATIGMGMGQPSRVDSCHTAFSKAGKKSKGAVLASDGFFPKPDSIELAKKHGISAIIQPGGSVQDEVVIKACDRARIAMVFTGIRHFKH